MSKKGNKWTQRSIRLQDGVWASIDSYTKEFGANKAYHINRAIIEMLEREVYKKQGGG